MIDLSQYRIIDLSLAYEKGMRAYSSEPAKSIEKEGWNARTLHLYSHAGTHMDAPRHFIANGQTIDEYSIESFLGPAWVVSVKAETPGTLIRVSDIAEVAQELVEGDSLIIRTGWSKFSGQQKYRDELPRISKELALWLVEKKIKMIGVEAPSVADVNNVEELTEIHRILLGGGIVIVESLANVELIKKQKVFLMALPLKIKGGDGAPARIIALEALR